MSGQLKGGSDLEKKNIIRHVVLNSLLSYRKKYKKEYGDMVIACDGRNYWRKDVFPHYKGMRKAGREKSDIDWSFIFETLNEIRDDIKNIFPWKIIEVEKCEADDIISVLVETTQEFGQHEPVMIISSDGDFIQLQQYDNVKQFSPIMKKLIVVNKKELKAKLSAHIVKGDSGDGIPNILSPADTIMTGTRQKSMTAARLEEFLQKGIDACRDETERARYIQNRELVNFEYIPEYIKTNIITTYLNIKPGGDQSTVMSYLIKNRCRQLLEDVTSF